MNTNKQEFIPVKPCGVFIAPYELANLRYENLMLVSIGDFGDFDKYTEYLRGEYDMPSHALINIHTGEFFIVVEP